MNDQAKQRSGPSCRINVRELPVIWLGHHHGSNQPSDLGVSPHHP
jgi:hypothetical protein